MEAWRNVWHSSSQRNTFIASFLAWTFDSFDFFLVVVIVSRCDFLAFAGQQHACSPASRQASAFNITLLIVFLAVTLTLLTRPLGAFLFGAMADRFGRLPSLLSNIGAIALIELLTALSPNFVWFLIFRAFFGIAMGGEWGVGAALLMECLPTKDQDRGLFSGILQAGYPLGNLLAAVVALSLQGVPWRVFLVAGALPAVLILIIRRRVQESPVWTFQHPEPRPFTFAEATDALRHEWQVMISSFRRDRGLFVYAILLMATLTFMSHGSQDSYALFLNNQVGFDPRVDQPTITVITAIYVAGAICGSILFGYQSDRLGRRRSLIVPAVLAILVVPLWTGLFPWGVQALSQAAFQPHATGIEALNAPPVILLAIGAFLMQFMVQGAYGVVPVHLNELSPAGLRGTFPGLAYQLGVAVAALGPLLVTLLAVATRTSGGPPNYALGQAIVLVPALIAAIAVAAFGHDRTGRALETADIEEPVAA